MPLRALLYDTRQFIALVELFPMGNNNQFGENSPIMRVLWTIFDVGRDAFLKKC
jgi:hypothetical protein